jgi:flagellar hook assembly protein FlgD
MGKEIISYDVMNYVWSGLNENGTKISEGSYYIILQATTENGDNYSKSEIISLYR